METLLIFGGVLAGAICAPVAVTLFKALRRINREISEEDDLYSYQFSQRPCVSHSWVEFGGLRGCSICGGTE